MPRPKRAPAEPAFQDAVMPGLEGLDPDPVPTEKPRRGRPPGSGRKAAPARASGSGKFTSKAALQKQVTTEIYGMANMLVSLWGIKDPCADVFGETVSTPNGTMDRLEAIVTQTVNILSRNEKVLTALANTGLAGEFAMLASLLLPVGKQLWQAHGPGGHGHRDTSMDVADNYDRYPAPALA